MVRGLALFVAEEVARIVEGFEEGVKQVVGGDDADGFAGLVEDREGIEFVFGHHFEGFFEGVLGCDRFDFAGHDVADFVVVVEVVKVVPSVGFIGDVGSSEIAIREDTHQSALFFDK